MDSVRDYVDAKSLDTVPSGSGKAIVNVSRAPDIDGEIYSVPRTVRMILDESWPFVFSRFFAMGANFATVAILSHRNNTYLDVAPLITSGQLITASSAVGVLYSVAIATGKNKGQGKISEIGGVLHSGLLLATVLSAPVILITSFAQPIYVVLGQKQELASLAQDYFRAFAPGVPAFLGMNAWQQSFIGNGAPKIVLLTTMQMTGVLAGLGYLFVHGGAGLDPMNVPGMGYAFSISCWTTLGTLALYSLTRKEYRDNGIFSRTSWKTLKENFKQLVNLGVPIGMQVIAELLTVFTITTFAGIFGEDDLAANAISDQYLTIFVVASFGFSQTAGALISRQRGANNFRNARRIGNAALGIGTLVSTSVALLFSLGHAPLSRLLKTSDFASKNGDTSNEALNRLLRNLFILNGIGEIFDYTRNIATGGLRGYFYTRVPMLISILSMTFIALGFGGLFGFATDMDLEGVYLGRTIGMFTGSLIMLLLWEQKSSREVFERTGHDDRWIRLFPYSLKDAGVREPLLGGKEEDSERAVNPDLSEIGAVAIGESNRSRSFSRGFCQIL